MKNHSLNRFSKYRKWSDIIDFDSIECKFSLFFTILFLILIYILDLYDEFQYFEESLKNISLYIASSLIGMIGIILAGIAIILGLLNKDIKNAIDKVNGEGTVERILVSFEFLAFIVAIQIFLFFSIYIVIHSSKDLIPYFTFLFVVTIICYLFFFTIFYTLSLIGNCIRFFVISNIYGEIVDNDKNLYTVINELRIDFILNNILKNVTKDEFMDELIDFVNSSNIDNKEAVKKYLIKYYGDEKRLN